MERVFAIAERPFDDEIFAAVAIGESDEDQRHIGILHRVAGANPEMLHLAWHCRLRNENCIPSYLTLWVAPSFEPQRLRTVAAFCRRVWKVNQSGGIPYAFSNPAHAFDAATGEFLLGPTRFGLTCASFVLAIFEHVGLRLADLISWPIDRQGDRVWQEEIVEKLESYAGREHIDHIRSEIGCVRYRPEEVAAASALAPPPVLFPDASVLGERILAKLKQT